MPRLTSVGDLGRRRDEIRRAMEAESGRARGRVRVHMSTCGIAAGAREIMAGLIADLDRRKVTDVIVAASSCAGLCSREPMVTVEMAGQVPVKYVDLTPAKMAAIVERHLLRGEIVAEFALATGSETTG